MPARQSLIKSYDIMKKLENISFNIDWTDQTET